MSVYRLNLFADYNQFYIWDSGVNPMAPEDYTEDDVRCMVMAVANVVVIQPVRAMTVPVELEVCPSDPGFDESHWDHVVECFLDLPTGSLQVHECTGGSVLDLAMEPGSYHVRALFSGLGTLSDDGLDGEDRYKVVLWPGPPVAFRVVKQWPEAPNGAR